MNKPSVNDRRISTTCDFVRCKKMATLQPQPRDVLDWGWHMAPNRWDHMFWWFVLNSLSTAGYYMYLKQCSSGLKTGILPLSQLMDQVVGSTDNTFSRYDLPGIFPMEVSIQLVVPQELNDLNGGRSHEEGMRTRGTLILGNLQMALVFFIHCCCYCRWSLHICRK